MVTGALGRIATSEASSYEYARTLSHPHKYEELGGGEGAGVPNVPCWICHCMHLKQEKIFTCLDSEFFFKNHKNSKFCLTASLTA